MQLEGELTPCYDAFLRFFSGTVSARPPPLPSSDGPLKGLFKVWLRGSASSGGPLKAIVSVNGKEGGRRPPDQDMWKERDGGHQLGVKAIKRPSQWPYQESPLWCSQTKITSHVPLIYRCCLLIVYF